MYYALTAVGRATYQDIAPLRCQLVRYVARFFATITKASAAVSKETWILYLHLTYSILKLPLAFNGFRLALLFSSLEKARALGGCGDPEQDERPQDL